MSVAASPAPRSAAASSDRENRLYNAKRLFSAALRRTRRTEVQIRDGAAARDERVNRARSQWDLGRGLLLAVHQAVVLFSHCGDAERGQPQSRNAPTCMLNLEMLGCRNGATELSDSVSVREPCQGQSVSLRKSQSAP